MIKDQISGSVGEREHSDLLDRPVRNNAAHMPQTRRVAGNQIPFTQRPTCTIAEACNAAGLGRTKLYELIGGGALETTTIGRRRLVRISSLLKLLKIESP